MSNKFTTTDLKKVLEENGVTHIYDFKERVMGDYIEMFIDNNFSDHGILTGIADKDINNTLHNYVVYVNNKGKVIGKSPMYNKISIFSENICSMETSAKTFKIIDTNGDRVSDREYSIYSHEDGVTSTITKLSKYVYTIRENDGWLLLDSKGKHMTDRIYSDYILTPTSKDFDYAVVSLDGVNTIYVDRYGKEYDTLGIVISEEVEKI